MYASVLSIVDELRGLLVEALDMDAAGVEPDLPLFDDGLTGESLGMDSLEALTLFTHVADRFGLDQLWLDGREELPQTLMQLAELVHQDVQRKRRTAA